MAFEDLTNLDFEITREPGKKKDGKRAYVNKVHGLTEALQAGGHYKGDYEAILLDLGIKAARIEPEAYGLLEIDHMNAEQALALLTAIVKKDERVEGFAAMCLESGFIEELLVRLETIDYENREIPSWIEDAVDDIIPKLMDLPKGTETTANRLIQPYLHYIDANGVYRERPYDFLADECDIVDTLRKKAKDYGLYLDSSAYVYMTIGTPGNIPFQVRKLVSGCDGPRVIFKFDLGGWNCGLCSLRIDEYADEYVCIMNDRELLISQEIKNITQDQLVRLSAVIEEAGIREWKPGYIDNTVLDGESWSILINDANVFFESSGSNEYPPTFDMLLSGLHDIFDLEFELPKQK